MRSPTPNCLQITTFIHRIAPVFGVIFLAACGPVGPGESGAEADTSGTTESGDETGTDTGGETDDTPDLPPEPDLPDEWDTGVWAEEPGCYKTVDGVTTCLGLPTGSTDIWVTVVSESCLDSYVDLELFVEVDAWTAETCTPGTAPANFLPDSVCYFITDQGASACFSGGDGWFAPVTPSCDLTLGADLVWPMCADNVAVPPPNPWSDVACGDDLCNGVSNDDTMVVYPTCWVSQQTPAGSPC